MEISEHHKQHLFVTRTVHLPAHKGKPGSGQNTPGEHSRRLNFQAQTPSAWQMEHKHLVSVLPLDFLVPDSQSHPLCPTNTELGNISSPSAKAPGSTYLT